jgi:hypothetical protein
LLTSAGGIREHRNEGCGVFSTRDESAVIQRGDLVEIIGAVDLDLRHPASWLPRSSGRHSSELASTNSSCDEMRGYDLYDLYDQNFARVVCQAKRRFVGRL